jgi:putative SOS response-associated peptidase YedK
MCGRFTLTAEQEKIAEAFAGYAFKVETRKRFNIAPTQEVAVILNDGAGEITLARWGLIPRWATDPSIGSRMINARSESLADKPAFRGLLRRQRCLVLADGFYEWRTVPGDRVKVPYWFRLRSRRPFAFAGLWDRWQQPGGGELTSCTIVTTSANDVVKPVHDRMPVLLKPAACQQWLTVEDTGTAEPFAVMLQPYPATEMDACAVSSRVNSPKNDDPSCCDPAGVQSEFGFGA